MITDFQIELMLATGLLVWGYIVFVKLSQYGGNNTVKTANTFEGSSKDPLVILKVKSKMNIKNKKSTSKSAGEFSSYIDGLRAYANSCVQRDQIERSKKPTSKRRRLLGTFKSSSSDTMYRVFKSNTITCTCPGYSFRRNCKHVKEFI